MSKIMRHKKIRFFIYLFLGVILVPASALIGLALATFAALVSLVLLGSIVSGTGSSGAILGIGAIAALIFFSAFFFSTNRLEQAFHAPVAKILLVDTLQSLEKSLCLVRTICKGFTYVFSVVIFAWAVTLVQMPVPVRPKAYVSAAMAAIATMAKECAVRLVKGEVDPHAGVSKLKNYKIMPQTGSCKGDSRGRFAAISEDRTTYPDLFYEIETGIKGCSHDGPSNKLNGCSDQRDGRW